MIALLLSAYLALVIDWADWATHPALASVAAVCGLGSVVVTVVSAWAQRPDTGLVSAWRMRRLPRTTRRALLRQLRAGDPGPPELHSWAAYCTCLRLQAPWAPAVFLVLAANNAASAAASGSLGVWQPAALIAVFTLAALGVIASVVHRPAARRVADALDQRTSATLGRAV